MADLGIQDRDRRTDWCHQYVQAFNLSNYEWPVAHAQYGFHPNHGAVNALLLAGCEV